MLTQKEFSHYNDIKDQKFINCYFNCVINDKYYILYFTRTAVVVTDNNKHYYILEVLDGVNYYTLKYNRLCYYDDSCEHSKTVFCHHENNELLFMQLLMNTSTIKHSYYTVEEMNNPLINHLNYSNNSQINGKPFTIISKYNDYFVTLDNDNNLISNIKINTLDDYFDKFCNAYHIEYGHIHIYSEGNYDIQHKELKKEEVKKEEFKEDINEPEFRIYNDEEEYPMNYMLYSKYNLNHVFFNEDCSITYGNKYHENIGIIYNCFIEENNTIKYMKFKKNTLLFYVNNNENESSVFVTLYSNYFGKQYITIDPNDKLVFKRADNDEVINDYNLLRQID